MALDRATASALLFLTLGIWLGPSRALFLVLIAVAIAGWFWLIRRHPLVGWAILGFLRGLGGR